MSMSYLDSHLEAAPTQAPAISQLADFWQKKLWHQMADALMEVTRNEYFQQNGRLLEMHERFVLSFADSLKQLVFVQFSVAASKQLSDAKSALAFIEKVAKLEHVQNDHQAALMCKLEAAHLLVIAGNIELAKTELAQSKKLQDEYPGIMETVVYSKYHLVSLCLFKATDQASKYFASAMLYLTYTPLDSIPIDEASVPSR